MQIKKNELEPDMEQWTGSKFGQEVCQGCILSPCSFNLYAEWKWNWKWSRSVVFDSLWPCGLAHQAPLSMGFSRQEYWSGLPCLPPGNLPYASLASPALASRFLTTSTTGKSLKSWDYQTTLPVFWETYMQVKKQQLESDMEQQTGSRLGKEYINWERSTHIVTPLM